MPQNANVSFLEPRGDVEIANVSVLEVLTYLPELTLAPLTDGAPDKS